MDGTHNEFTAAVESVVNAQHIDAVNIHPVERVRTPNEVASPPESFTDRDDVRARLDRLAGPASLRMPLVVVISGPRGIGVSALIAKWVADNNARFPAGNLHFYFQREKPGSPDVGTALMTFLTSLGVDDWAVPNPLPKLVARYRTLTSEAPILVVLEGVTDAAQVRSLIPKAPGSVVLVAAADGEKNTFEELTVGNEAEPIRLFPLSSEHSRALLVKLLKNEDIPEDPVALSQIVQACHGNPLALSTVAGICKSRKWDLAEVAALLHDEVLRPAEVRQAEVEATAFFDLSFRYLPPSVQEMALAIGQIPGADFTVGLATAAADVSPAAANRALERLARANLLYRTDKDRCYLHDEFRAYLRGKGDPAVLRRVLDRQMAYVAHADQATVHEGRQRGFELRPYLDRIPAPFADSAVALRWLRSEHANLLQTEREIARLGWHREVAEFAVMMGAFNYNVRSLTAFEEWTTLGIESAAQIGAAEIQARLLMMRSSVHYDRDDLDGMKADTTAALSIARSLGGPGVLGSALEYYGRYKQKAGDYVSGRQAFRESITCWRRISSKDGRRGEGIAHYRFGALLIDAEDVPAALDELRTAATILTEINDERMAGRVRIASGIAYGKTGELAQARAALTHAVETFERLDLPHYQAQAMEELAKVAEPADGLALLQAVRDIYVQALHPRADDVKKEIDRRRQSD